MLDIDLPLVEDINNNTSVDDTTSTSSYDSVGKMRGFQIGKSLQSVIDESSDLMSCSETELNSLMSLNSDKTVENDMEIDIEMFDGKNLEESQDGAEIVTQEEVSISSLIARNNLRSVDSVTSLRSMDSIPTFLGKGSIKKWDNYQNLDGISIDSSMFNFGWADGESDAGMLLMLFAIPVQTNLEPMKSIFNLRIYSKTKYIPIFPD